MSITKTCSKCKTERDRSEFYSNKTAKDGLNWQCKHCQKAYYRKHRVRLIAKERERARGCTVNMRRRTEVNAQEKVCRKCGVLKPRTEYYRAPRMGDGLNAQCKMCIIRTVKTYQSTRKRVPNSSRQWHRKHPEIARARKIAGRARAVGAVGRFTGKELLAKFEFHGWRCYLCKAVLPTFASAHAEHRKPLEKGGSNWIANIAPSCFRCNSRKHTYSESQYRYRALNCGKCPTCGSALTSRLVLNTSLTIPHPPQT